MRKVSYNCRMTSFLAAEIAYKLIKLKITSFLPTLTKVKAHYLRRFRLIDDRYRSYVYLQFVYNFQS